MAGTTFTIDTRELEALARNLATAPIVTAQESRVAMERSTILVQNAARVNLREQRAIDTGRLVNSVAREVAPFRGIVGTNVVYARPVEDGRQPGAPMPPAGALDGWLRRHGIPASADFAIRLSISRKGIKARPFLRPALEGNRRAIDAEFAAANRRIVVRLTRRAP